MGKLDLRVRDLHSGVSSLTTFETEEAATAWLTARPPFVEVLGVATPGLATDVNNRLRAANRALDAAERAQIAKLDAAIDAVARERDEEKRQHEQAAAEAHKASLRGADPLRIMEVHWTYAGTFELVDAADERPVTDEAREAVLAWVRERDEWVEGRGQVVGDAKVWVWPGPLPLPAAARGERVKQGSFIPVTAPAKKP